MDSVKGQRWLDAEAGEVEVMASERKPICRYCDDWNLSSGAGRRVDI